MTVNVIDPEEVIRVCAQEWVPPSLTKEPVHYVTDEMFRDRILAHKFNTDTEDEERTVNSAST